MDGLVRSRDNVVHRPPILHVERIHILVDHSLEEDGDVESDYANPVLLTLGELPGDFF